MVVKRADLIRHAQIVDLVIRTEAIGRHSGHVGVVHLAVLPSVQIIAARILRGDPSEALVAGSLDARPAFTSDGRASVSSVAFVRAAENQNAV
jgi:hypothetical protein